MAIDKKEMNSTDSENGKVETKGHAGDFNNGFKKSGFWRQKHCIFSVEGAPKIDYKDVRLLSKFLSERGKIIPSRVTSVCFKKQRELAKAIKRARFLALIPYVND